MKCQIGHGDVVLFFLWYSLLCFYADFYNRHTENNDYAKDCIMLSIELGTEILKQGTN